MQNLLVEKMSFNKKINKNACYGGRETSFYVGLYPQTFSLLCDDNANI